MLPATLSYNKFNLGFFFFFLAKEFYNVIDVIYDSTEPGKSHSTYYLNIYYIH